LGVLNCLFQNGCPKVFAAFLNQIVSPQGIVLSKLTLTPCQQLECLFVTGYACAFPFTIVEVTTQK
jgi:hypothetical protein